MKKRVAAGSCSPPGFSALLMVAVWLLSACASAPPPPAPAAPPAPAPPTPDQQFDALAARYLLESPEQSPVNATGLGDHRFDAKLDDVSASAWQARQSFAELYLAALEGIDRGRLSRDRQVDALLLRNELEQARFRVQELQDWRWNPLVYTRIAGDGLYGLMARDFAPASARFANLGKRLDEIPRFLAQVREVLEPARVPKIHAETAVRQNQGLKSMLDGDIATEVAKLPGVEQEPLRASMARARSAIAQHQIWLEKKLLPEAKGDFRIGVELYDKKLAFALVSPMTRQEIRERAESELAATHRAMYAIAREVLKGKRNAPRMPDDPSDAQRLRAIKTALELAYAERPKREGVLDAARASLEDATRFVREHDIVTVPGEPLKIITMPEFQQGVALAYCDSPGPLERNLDTFYAVSPIPKDWTRAQVDSFLREYNSRSIQNLTIHEAMPGHYLQLAHANRYPSVLRAVLSSGPFIEGWAVYGEGVMIEQGYMDGDPLMKLIQLKWYVRSIVNALLDQAVHVDGMPREAAMKLLTDQGFQEEREAAGKWVRAQLTSAQLPTYFVGAQEHMALRAEAEQKLGAAFNLKEYHDKLLSYGSPPVRYVRALMFDLPVD
ncbi:MAG TPA: DUF885 domain-containing protein [Steroidobacteraceae bacterium]|nr:DUF885 domain-containing protein [Steroidobacteraceae bacterium]